MRLCLLARPFPPERKKKEDTRKGGGGGGEGRCGLEYGFGFPSFRGELKSIDTEAESEADRVAAKGCTGTQRERDLHAHKVTSPTPSQDVVVVDGGGGQSKIRRGKIVVLELEVCTG